MKKGQTQKNPHLAKGNEKIEYQLKIAHFGQTFGAVLLLTGLLIISGLSIYLSMLNGGMIIEFILKKIGPITVIMGLIIGFISSALRRILSVEKRKNEEENNITDQNLKKVE